jgi:hypothetical protein
VLAKGRIASCAAHASVHGWLAAAYAVFWAYNTSIAAAVVLTHLCWGTWHANGQDKSASNIGCALLHVSCFLALHKFAIAATWHVPDMHQLVLQGDCNKGSILVVSLVAATCNIKITGDQK